MAVELIHRALLPNGIRAICSPYNERLAVEILSPSNRKAALQSKINIYTTHGIEAWLVDPKRQEVKVYAAGKVRIASFKYNPALTWNGKSFLLAAVFHLPG